MTGYNFVAFRFLNKWEMVAACGLETAGVKCGYLKGKLKTSHNRKKGVKNRLTVLTLSSFFVGHVVFSLATL